MTPSRGTIRALGCLFKAPLGCLAFFIGATVVFILFLPPTAGRFTAGAIEDGFNRSFAGRLDLDEAWLLSFYSPQRIGELTLYDPDGRVVLDGRLAAPPMGEFFDDDGLFGPLRITVDRLDIVRGADGVTNLTRALERRPGADLTLGTSFQLNDRDAGMVKETVIELSIRRLRWWSEERQDELAVNDFLAAGSLVTTGEDRLELEIEGTGTLFEDGQAGRVQLRVYVGDALALLSAPPGTAPGRVDLSLEELPSARLDLLRGEGEFFDAALGPRTRSFRMTADRLAPGQVEVGFEVQSDSAKLAVHGRLDADGRLVAGERGSLRTLFDAESGWTETVLEGVMPALTAIRSDEGAQRFKLTSSHFAIPLWGGAEALEGRFDFDLGAITYELDASLRSALPTGVERLRADQAQLSLVVDRGVVRYERVGLATGPGEALILIGSYDLRDRSTDVIVQVPGAMGETTAVHILDGWGRGSAPPTPPAPPEMETDR